jgi:hypothetical protein
VLAAAVQHPQLLGQDSKQCLKPMPKSNHGWSLFPYDPD